MDMYLVKNPEQGYSLCNYLPYAPPIGDPITHWWYFGHYRTDYPFHLPIKKLDAAQLEGTIGYVLQPGEAVNLTTGQVTALKDAEPLPPAHTRPL